MEDRKTRNFNSIVASLQKDTEDLKTVQPIGGVSFINYTVYSDAPYDFSSVMSPSIKSFRITFTHTEPGKYHITKPSVFIRANNPNVLENPYIAAGLSQLYVIHVIPERPTRGSQNWIVDVVDVFGGNTIYFKVFFKGTVSGTFNMVQI